MWNESLVTFAQTITSGCADYSGSVEHFNIFKLIVLGFCFTVSNLINPIFIQKVSSDKPSAERAEFCD